MKAALAAPWIPLERVEDVIGLEPLVVLIGLGGAAWLVHKLLLRDLSPDRHKLLRGLFVNMGVHALALVVLFSAFAGAHELAEKWPALDRVPPYLGFLTILSGAAVSVKIVKILAFEYLFLGHKREGVPLLLVNIATLLLSIVLAAWIVSHVFSIRLTPLLATSAIFSLVLGLALQDTLGNLFAGIAMQFDKPFELGDWIEIQGGGGKWTGQVQEISWRATVLLGWADEKLVLPNRLVAQSEVSNYSTAQRPIIRAQVFRIPYGAPLDRARRALLDAATSSDRVRRDPAPLVILMETTESWIVAKLVYFLDDFGGQFSVGDHVIEKALANLEKAGIALAGPRMDVAVRERTA